MQRSSIAVGLVVLGSTALAVVCVGRFLVHGGPEPISGVAPRNDSGPLVSEAPIETLSTPAADEVRVPAEAPAPSLPRPAESVAEKLARLRESAGPIVLEGQLYHDVPKADLEQVVKRIENLIYDATKEELEYRFAARVGIETLSTDPNYHYRGEGYDPKAVYWVRFTPGGPTEKVTLPKDEFPEIYELKALSAALRDEIHSRGSGAE
jgi:hypothetical protein